MNEYTVGGDISDIECPKCEKLMVWHEFKTIDDYSELDTVCENKECKQNCNEE